MGAPAEALDSGQVRNAMTVDVEDTFRSPLSNRMLTRQPGTVSPNVLKIIRCVYSISLLDMR